MAKITKAKLEKMQQNHKGKNRNQKGKSQIGKKASQIGKNQN